MSIESTDALLVKAEIKARIFEKAFMELGREFARQNPQGVTASAGPIIEAMQRFNVRSFLPPASSQMNALDLKDAQDVGLTVAIETLQVAFRKFTKPGRTRP